MRAYFTWGKVKTFSTKLNMAKTKIETGGQQRVTVSSMAMKGYDLSLLAVESFIEAGNAREERNIEI